MKKVQFRTTTMEIQGEQIPLDYQIEIGKLMLIPLDPQKGSNYEEMDAIMPILAKLKLAKLGYVLLEDAEHKLVVERLKAAHFIQNTLEIHTMLSSVINAPDHLIEAIDADNSTA